MTRHEVDAAVVGGGPAGLAAAAWLARYRRSVVVLDSEDYRAGAVDRSHGYLGRDPQVPRELSADGRAEVCAYPTAELRPGVRVEHVARRDDGMLEVGADLLCHRLVLACGVTDTFPDVEGFAEHYGASVFHCPACDGYEARDRDVVALGWDARLVGFAATLLTWARSVTVVTNGQRFEGDDACRATMVSDGTQLVEQTAVRLVGGRSSLQGLELDSGRVLPATLVFFSVAHSPNAQLARTLGCRLDDEGFVAVDDEGQTSVPGVYAAGDLTPGLQLVQVAAASGTVAGVAAAQSLFGRDGAAGSPDAGPDPSPPA